MTDAAPPAEREPRSLFGEILDWMLAPLLLLWPMSLALTWLVAQSIADMPYDSALGEVAQGVARQLVVAGGRQPTPALRITPLYGAGDAPTEIRYYQVRNPRGELVSGIDSLVLPSDALSRPAGEVHFRNEILDGFSVRVASLRVDVPDFESGSPLLVQVAESHAKRDSLAGEIIKGVILPQFMILPVVVVLLWLALARGFAPLAELQRRIRRRDSADLSPIDAADVPEELSPLVRAINHLLNRLDLSVSLQRRFLTDAAHQLKTPLAGLRTQAELAQRSLDGGKVDLQQVRRSLQQIERGSQSAAHTVDQLLAMARTENAPQTARAEPVDLGALAAETVRDFVPKAMEKRIDLGFEGPAQGLARIERPSWQPSPGGALQIRGDAVLLRELIRNLVDNALQYTPAGGTATVRVIADPFGQVVVLQVEDSGPGIAPAERELVFQSFYRALGTQVDGSGLGLAIVREIAVQHRAELLLEDANLRHRPGLSDQACAAFGPGARFTLRFRLDARTS